MRALVPGPTGNVGRYVVAALHRRNVDVRRDALFLLRPPAIARVGGTLNAFVEIARR